MSELKEFLKNPSAINLERLSGDLLLGVSDNYGIGLSYSDKRNKENIRAVIWSALVDKRVLTDLNLPGSEQRMGLTFEQQRELLLIQREMESSRQSVELRRLDVEVRRLNMIQEGKIDGVIGVGDGVHHTHELKFDIVGNLRLVPPFAEEDVDTFFTLFEQVADAQGWPSESLTVLLWCVFTGRAQRAYSALSTSESKNYESGQG